MRERGSVTESESERKRGAEIGRGVKRERESALERKREKNLLFIVKGKEECRDHLYLFFSSAFISVVIYSVLQQR